MTFEIPFDGLVYKAQSALLFNAASDKTRKNIRRILTTGIFGLLLGTLIMLGKESSGGILVLIGVAILFFAYIYYDAYKNQKKKYFDAIEKSVAASLENNEITVVEIQEDYFRHTDFKMDCTFKWINFTGYRKIEDTLFLYTNIGVVFMLSSSHTGNDNFIAIIAFIESKSIKIMA
jgi:hypothetical protein